MNAPRDEVLSWLVTLFAGWYVAWTGYCLSRNLPVFRQLFSSLGADLPLPTRLVIAVCIPAVLWPLVVAVVAFLVVKEFKLERVRTRVIMSTIIFMATASAAAVITEAIFQPMFQLIKK